MYSKVLMKTQKRAHITATASAPEFVKSFHICGLSIELTVVRV
jgi:hypothetical protein